MKILSNLSFRKMVAILAIVPMLAIVALGGMLSWSAYKEYSTLQGAAALQEIVHSAGELILLMPVEGAAKGEELIARRKEVNARHADILAAYEATRASGILDTGLDAAIENLQAKFTRLPEYRSAVDAGVAKPLLALEILLPISSASSEVTRRVGVMTEDRTLSRSTAGYYAFMQVNDGFQVFNRVGVEYIQSGQLNQSGYTMFLSGSLMANAFEHPFRESASQDILARYDAFWETPEGKMIQRFRADFAKNDTYAAPAGELEKWVAANIARRTLVAGLLNETGDRIAATMDASLTAAFAHLVTLLSILAAVVVASIALSTYVAHTLSQFIRSIGDRMTSLAGGETDQPIPYTGRKDEIGGMARSVGVFRDAAIQNRNLEHQAERSRKQAERDRVEMQRRAEAEAEERLTQATGALASGLRQLAAGDMVCEITERFAEQFEPLRMDFNASVQQLRDALTAVGRSASSVNSGSAEISNASSDLAKRTEQQAAALEETAAALEQITSNVVATTKRTGEARQVAQTARSTADQSGTIVRDAVSAMEKIEQSSRQIGQIIGVIDEIAFQTNLLALNAGVEAARAGDAGKGFAVVAQEVRELAQRSANAAKEIKSLISNSAAAVGEGVKLVNGTGEGLTAIEALVQTINEHMDAIATAAQEQSVGLAEVNTAVNHMDQATQQNAAMVEEMNAAGISLAEESTQLHSLIGNFRLGNQIAMLKETSRQMRSASQPTAAVRSTPVASARPTARPRLAVASGASSAAIAHDNWEEF
ncbi:methyl-accepting chemotaxis protein [Rhizobium sp. KVB221]|uniref:Methyl-accepting chemotaxis protein n=1 Tax=Rhizobium setariae TaxID=2801340 RepID=A0A936YVW6_9HYPH|nr:methyl-accepting chemotaxis protein [Rhizobium setariae]MBL0374517.1 methyl-accepting chemotaxis protein [Rhizobium setariae]